MGGVEEMRVSMGFGKLVRLLLVVDCEKFGDLLQLGQLRGTFGTWLELARDPGLLR